ncbi:MAG: pyridoxamine 5'-phosphate oxidase family protein [Chloroflexi bacterium]|nr:pyridoxamine 5'-phosphate oxidase family protein [Chloroflexota bacterium]
MADVHDSITPALAAFIGRQSLFFVASAPLSADGHVNVSPKGLDTLRVLSPRRVAYLDLTGSGNETSAHLAENGRVTLMFCAFDGPPRILRLFGAGRTVLPADAEWDELRRHFPEHHVGVRQVIVADIHRVQTSCGYAVPRMDLVEERDTLDRWARNRGDDRLDEYRREHNVVSIDGLPTPIAACWPEPGREPI